MAAVTGAVAAVLALRVVGIGALPLGAAEAGLAAQALGAGTGGGGLVAGGDSGWLAALQFAGGAAATGVSGVVGLRVVALAASAVTAVLLWLLVRRLGTARVTATAAVLLMALWPAAVSADRTVTAENLGICWALAGLVVAAGPRSAGAARRDPWWAVGFAACLGMAILTAPSTVALVPAAAWLAARRTDWWRAAAGTLVIALAGLAWLAAAALAPVETAAAGFGVGDRWAGLLGDPATPVLGVVLGAVALNVIRLQPVGLGLVLLPVATFAAASSSAGVAVSTVPLAALVVAAAAERAVAGWRALSAGPTASAAAPHR